MGSFPKRILSKNLPLWGRGRRPHPLTGHTQNSISTALCQLNPHKTCSTERGENDSPEEVRELFSGLHKDTSFLLQSVGSVLSFSFGGAAICLLTKMTQHTHARHSIPNGFTNTCALRTVREGKPETPPSRVRIHPWTLPLRPRLVGLCT